MAVGARIGGSHPPQPSHGPVVAVHVPGALTAADMLIPGRRSQGLIVTCVIGIAGALLGGWLATKLFHVVTLHGFFNLSTWLTAIAGAAVLLLAYHLLTGRSSGRNSQRSRRWAHR